MMLTIRSTILLLLLSMAWVASGQTLSGGGEIQMLEDSIAREAERMWSSELPAERKAHSARVRSLLSQVLKLTGAWEHPFDSLKYVSVQKDPGGSFRFFTWQTDLGDGRYQRQGFLQVGGKPAEVIALNDRSALVLSPDTHSGGTDEWIGMVYYRILPFKKKGKKHWLLFGFANGEAGTLRKMIDVLHFTGEGKPVFGAPVFEFGSAEEGDLRIQNRFSLEYDARSKVKLNWEESLDLIQFDHLIPFADGRSGEKVVFIPDGTYEGFRLSKGIWKHVDKLEIKAMDEAPVDFPVLDSRKGKDLFGKSKG